MHCRQRHSRRRRVQLPPPAQLAKAASATVAGITHRRRQTASHLRAGPFTVDSVLPEMRQIDQSLQLPTGFGAPALHELNLISYRARILESRLLLM